MSDNSNNEIYKLRQQLAIAKAGLEKYSTWKNWARPYTHCGDLGIKRSLYRMGNEDGQVHAENALNEIQRIEEQFNKD